jgi:hypothetical protein
MIRPSRLSKASEGRKNRPSRCKWSVMLCWNSKRALPFHIEKLRFLSQICGPNTHKEQFLSSLSPIPNFYLTESITYRNAYRNCLPPYLLSKK